MILKTDQSFKRSFKRLTRKNPQLQDKILEVLEVLSNDPFTPSLKSHKLGGKLDGLWYCSIAYDCRIIFAFRTDITIQALISDILASFSSLVSWVYCSYSVPA